MTPFAAALEQVRHELDAGRLSEAHYQLSRWYDDPNLTPQEQQHLNELLDQLAGTVIYSTQNLMEPACEVQQGETLERIAQRYNVPWQLLAKINGIEDPHSLRPGERLKVVRGPFSAVISLEKHTLTLMLNNAYAGRFPIGVGQDFPPPEGQYFVNDKLVDPILLTGRDGPSNGAIRPTRWDAAGWGWGVSSAFTARTIRVTLAKTACPARSAWPTATSTMCSTSSAKARKSLSGASRPPAECLGQAAELTPAVSAAFCRGHFPGPPAPAVGPPLVSARLRMV